MRATLTIDEPTDEREVQVPADVFARLARNKARVVKESGQSLSSVFKRAKDAFVKFGDPKKRQGILDELNELDYRIPSLGDAVNGTIGRIEALLKRTAVIEIGDAVKARAAQRAIDKVAPFHRQRNGIDDAILIEVYADSLGAAASGDRFEFVTHNTRDFSDPAGNNKTPHPDLAPLFSKIKSRYFITLAESVKRVRPELVSDLMLEHEEWVEQPRSLSEIVDAIGEMLDKVWYGRHKHYESEIKSGKVKIVGNDAPHDPKTCREEIWKGALKSAKKVEKKYGADNLHWDSFDWGMLNGKLSALRWVLGDEWDMLDT